MAKAKSSATSEADAAGIWRPGANVEGKACLRLTDKLRVSRPVQRSVPATRELIRS